MQIGESSSLNSSSAFLADIHQGMLFLINTSEGPYGSSATFKHASDAKALHSSNDSHSAHKENVSSNILYTTPEGDYGRAPRKPSSACNADQWRPPESKRSRVVMLTRDTSGCCSEVINSNAMIFESPNTMEISGHARLQVSQEYKCLHLDFTNIQQQLALAGSLWLKFHQACTHIFHAFI
ncbi:hypothetical protein PIB30_066214 [Stylosanthes scabra]|uniref:Uncharacterized protein n=1 Tax=Stylosanthes scabra TaxID=79078 RepID=A0ABU6YJS0_9FABA|nr:hypothetical protein [Stylosanthes scabra]